MVRAANSFGIVIVIEQYRKSSSTAVARKSRAGIKAAGKSQGIDRRTEHAAPSKKRGAEPTERSPDPASLLFKRE
jgi:hypothetical protein